MNREQLNKIHELTREVNRNKEIASELLRTAQDRYNEREHEIERDGKKITVREKDLWTEVFHLGTLCDSGKFMAKLHPEVFEAYKKEATAAVELERFCLAEFGFNFRAMTISDYLMMTEQMYDLLMRETLSDKALSWINNFVRFLKFWK